MDPVEAKAPKPKQTSQLCRWAITYQDATWIDPQATVDKWLPLLKEYFEIINAGEWICQLERGKEAVNGHLHFQCIVKVKTKIRDGPLKRLANEQPEKWGPRMHIRPATTENEMRLKQYCMKRDETYVMGPWGHKSADDLMAEAKAAARPKATRRDPPPAIGWQRPFLIMIRKPVSPSDRRVYVICCEEGHSGKSVAVQHLIRYDNFINISAGDSEKMVDMIYNKSETPEGLGGVVFDLPRDVPDKVRNAIWSTAEQIKNGTVSKSRYECKEFYVAPMNVVVFTNKLPAQDEIKKLSADRWHIIALTAEDVKPFKEMASRDYLLNPGFGKTIPVPGGPRLVDDPAEIYMDDFKEDRDEMREPSLKRAKACIEELERKVAEEEEAETQVVVQEALHENARDRAAHAVEQEAAAGDDFRVAHSRFNLVDDLDGDSDCEIIEKPAQPAPAAPKKKAAPRRRAARNTGKRKRAARAPSPPANPAEEYLRLQEEELWNTN